MVSCLKDTAKPRGFRAGDPRYSYLVFGLTFEKLLIIGVIAAFLIGPERLPLYAGKLRQFVRSMRDFADGAKDRMRDEMGPEFDEVDWKKLDPRQYDPRRIIREALLDDGPAAGVAGAAAATAIKPVTESAYAQHKRKLQAGAVPPFDTEAT
jgi:sec-independent protein translocase protein TatB